VDRASLWRPQFKCRLDPALFLVPMIHSRLATRWAASFRYRAHALLSLRGVAGEWYAVCARGGAKRSDVGRDTCVKCSSAACYMTWQARPMIGPWNTPRMMATVLGRLNDAKFEYRGVTTRVLSR